MEAIKPNVNICLCQHTDRKRTGICTYIPTVLFVICRSSTKCGFAVVKEGLTKRLKETEDRKLRKVRIEKMGSLISGKRGPETIEDVRLL
jgi:hypothetical protein